MCVSTKKKLLINNFDNIVKNVILEISYRSNFNIETLETDEDHIHMLISYPPKLSVTSIVRKLKQETIIYLWKNYSKFLSLNFYLNIFGKNILFGVTDTLLVP